MKKSTNFISNTYDIRRQRFCGEYKSNYDYFKKQNTGEVEARKVLAALSGIAPGTLSRYASGKQAISEKSIELLAPIWGVRPEYLTGEDNCRTQKDYDEYVRQSNKASLAVEKICAIYGIELPNGITVEMEADLAHEMCDLIQIKLKEWEKNGIVKFQ